MSGWDIKGWCPGALRPMASGDGLVVRVRPPLGRFTPAQAGAIARATGVDRLILTHLHPDSLPREIEAAASEAMGCRVWVAEPGRRYAL